MQSELLVVLGVFVAVYACVGLVTFAAFGWDKRCAERGARRIPERTLHALEMFGGWPGALLGMQAFRHKRRKPGYFIVTWAIALGHCLGFVAWLLR